MQREYGRNRGVPRRGRRNFGNNSKPRTSIYYSDNWVLKIFGFPEETTEDELRELLFSLNKYLTVFQIVIRRNVHNHRPPTFALVEFGDFEEAVDAFSRIDGIDFKELKISAQFDRSSVCTVEAFYRNQCGRQNGSEPRRFQDNNNNNNNNNNNDYNYNSNNNRFNERAEMPMSRHIFNNNYEDNEFRYPTTSTFRGYEDGPSCSKIQHNSSNLHESSRSDYEDAICRGNQFSDHQQSEFFPNAIEKESSAKDDAMERSSKEDMDLQEAWTSDDCKDDFRGRNQLPDHQQAESFSRDPEVESSAKDDAKEMSSREYESSYIKKVESKFIIKDCFSNQGDKFDESNLRDKPTNFEGRVCDKSLYPNDTLDDTRGLEIKHKVVEETGNSPQLSNIYQSSQNIKKRNPLFGPNSSGTCGKCGKAHGPHCPAYGNVCTYCEKLNHFPEMCFSKKTYIHQRARGQRSTRHSNGRFSRAKNNLADKNGSRVEMSNDK